MPPCEVASLWPTCGNPLCTVLWGTSEPAVGLPVGWEGGTAAAAVALVGAAAVASGVGNMERDR